MGLPSENGIYYVLLKDGRMGLVPRTPAGMLRIRGRSIYVPEDDWTRAAQAMSGYVADAVLDMTPRRFVTEGQAEYETECSLIFPGYGTAPCFPSDSGARLTDWYYQAEAVYFLPPEK